ncbi:MAG: hypothetical protein EB096_13285 [Betaproteobacteria bacterium]|jgi:hypothetical protein|nr:hypothetical protein [Betaproteobacteria bacterium]NDF66101.1 hypothetical protein [Betaproteobacteria bacterium]
MVDSFNSIRDHSSGTPLSRVTLFDNSDFRYLVRLQPVPAPVGGYALTISSQWASAAHPQQEQVKFRACLNRLDLTRLQKLIQQELAS